MTSPAPKSPLLGFHKVSIGAAIALGVLYTAYSLRAYSDTGEQQDLIIALLTGGTTIGLAFYLRWFARKRT